MHGGDDVGVIEVSFANKTRVATEERAPQDTREQIRQIKCEETQETQESG